MFVTGDVMSWLSSTGTMIVSWVALFVGLFLVGRALLDIRSGLGKDSKDMGKAAIGLGVGLVGGLIGWWGASAIITFFKSNGKQIPHS